MRGGTSRRTRSTGSRRSSRGSLSMSSRAHCSRSNTLLASISGPCPTTCFRMSCLRLATISTRRPTRPIVGTALSRTTSARPRAWQIETPGRMKMPAPVIVRIGRCQKQRIWGGLSDSWTTRRNRNADAPGPASRPAATGPYLSIQIQRLQRATSALSNTGRMISDGSVTPSRAGRCKQDHERLVFQPQMAPTQRPSRPCQTPQQAPIDIESNPSSMTVRSTGAGCRGIATGNAGLSLSAPKRCVVRGPASERLAACPTCWRSSS